jgi:serine/threonine protein kinase
MFNKDVSLKILNLLGEGSQGSVYKALRRDRRAGLEQLVAVKILHSQITVEHWRLEFESLARVRSRYCVQVLSFERQRGRPALVLEYVDGITLAELIQSYAFKDDEVGELLAQLECALQDLHGQSVLHGDLSPQNIMIDRKGCIRLLDFGLANCSDQELRLTPRFAAPERLNGATPTVSTDIYALGRIEELLSGRARECYVHPDPNQRKLQSIQPRADRQSQLAETVDRVLAARAAARECVTECFTPAPKPRRFKASPAATLAAAISMLLTTSTASQLNRGAEIFVNCSVRTQTWHYLILNGKPIGYAPANLPLVVGASYELAWISVQGHGTVHLHPDNTRPLRLTDSDFSH